MKTILVAAQKGGVGKTTLVTNLAAALPGRTAIVDVDPQGSAFDWAELRKRNFGGNLDAIRATAAEVGKWKAAAARNRTDWLLIDSVGTSDAVLIEAARVADMILIPTKVNSLDVTALRNTLRLLRAFNIPQPVVINCVKSVFGFQFHETRATNAIQAFGGTLANVRLSDLVAFPDAMAVGQAAHEYKPGGTAARQVEALAAFTATKLAA